MVSSLDVGEEIVKYIEEEIDSIIDKDGIISKLYNEGDNLGKALDNEIKKCQNWIIEFQKIVQDISQNKQQRKKIKNLTSTKYLDKWRNKSIHNSYEEKRDYLTQEANLKKYELILKKGYVLLQRLRLLTRENEKEIKYEITMSIEEGLSENLKTVSVNMKEMLANVTLDFKQSEKDFENGISIIKRASLQVKKQKFENKYKTESYSEPNKESFNFIDKLYSTVFSGRQFNRGRKNELFQGIIKNNENNKDIETLKNEIEYLNNILKIEDEKKSLYTKKGLFNKKFFQISKTDGKVGIDFIKIKGFKGKDKKVSEAIENIEIISNRLFSSYILDNIPYFAQSGDDPTTGTEYKFVTDLRDATLSSADTIVRNIVLALNSLLEIKNGVEKEGIQKYKNGKYVLQGEIENKHYTSNKVNEAVLKNIENSLQQTFKGENISIDFLKNYF